MFMVLTPVKKIHVSFKKSSFLYLDFSYFFINLLYIYILLMLYYNYCNKYNLNIVRIILFALNNNKNTNNWSPFIHTLWPQLKFKNSHKGTKCLII